MNPNGVDRRLAAILSADVVGYGRLMAEDEEATVRTLTAYREEIGLLVRQHRGRVVDTPGDNLLAELPTALEAVRCAVEMQGVLEARNASLPAERRMEFRVGVHLGDVRAEGGRIYGDGVNIAARLEGLAEPGGVCISRTVREQVQDKLDLGYQDLGEQEIKNIPRPIQVYRVRIGGALPTPEAAQRPRRRALLAAGALLVVAVGSWVLGNLDRASPVAPDAGLPATDPGAPLTAEELTVPGFSGAPAIAVLPFDNLSGDPEQEYFADGIAEDLITRLSTRRTFPVIARNSSFIYKGKAVDVKRVSRELGVRYVVEGSVRKAGERVRISAQLIDGTTGHHVWAETYDRELRDIFALQDEITESIVASISPELHRSETERALRKSPRDLDAYEINLRGMWHLTKSTKQDNARAQALFERAVELDPDDAESIANLALSQYLDIVNQWSDSPARSAAELERRARSCAQLDRDSARCQIVLSYAHRVAGRREKEIAALERAVRFNPSHADAHGWLGIVLALAGRPDEAIASLEKAMRLSPRDPLMWMFLNGMGWAHFGAGRYQEAVDWAHRTVQHRPDHEYAYRTLAASHAHLGRLGEARSALKEALRLDPDLSLAKVGHQNPTTDPDFLARWLDGLRKAGLKQE